MKKVGSEVMTPVIAEGAAMPREKMHFAGLSSETKPTGSYEGVLLSSESSYFALDTGTIFFYNEENSTWYEQ